MFIHEALPVNDLARGARRRYRYRYVLFDWDGCLAQTLDVWLRAYRSAFAAFNLFPGDRLIVEQFGDWNGPKTLGISDDDYPAYMGHVVATAAADLAAVPLYPGAKELIAELSERGVGMALVTSGVAAAVSAGMLAAGIDQHLAAIVTGEQVVRRKPDPEALHQALARIGGNPHEAVMVGDSPKDLGAAANAGVESILFYPDSHRVFYDLDELKRLNPTHVCRSFTEVRATLLR